MSITSAARSRPLPAEKWVQPVQGRSVTTPFGKRGSMWSSGAHTGADIAAPAGTPVRAVAAGRVSSAGSAGAYGQRVCVVHRPGFETWYCHLSKMNVPAGRHISAGTVIGAVGETGNTTGPHLHLELRVDGVARDPQPYLSGAADSPSSPTFPTGAQPADATTNPAVVPAGISLGGVTDSIGAEVRRLTIVAALVLGGVALIATGVAQGSKRGRD